MAATCRPPSCRGMSCVARRHGLSFDSRPAADMLALALTTAVRMIVWCAHGGESVTVSRLGPTQAARTACPSWTETVDCVQVALLRALANVWKWPGPGLQKSAHKLALTPQRHRAEGQLPGADLHSHSRPEAADGERLLSGSTLEQDSGLLLADCSISQTSRSAQSNPSNEALSVAAARLLQSSFLKMLSRWVRTVDGLIPSRRAASLLLSPKLT